MMNLDFIGKALVSSLVFSMLGMAVFRRRFFVVEADPPVRREQGAGGRPEHSSAS